MAKNHLKPLDTDVMKLNFSENFVDSLMEHPAIQWVNDHKKKISYGILFFCFLLILLYRFLAYQTVQTEQNYVALSNAASIINNPAVSEEKRMSALSDLKKMLENTPNLHSKYDGLIAEQLIIEKNLDEAAPYTERTFSRIEQLDLPYYIDYAKTSIVLAAGNKDEGLNQAYTLRDKMLQVENKEPKFGGILYAFNLIRIALLENELQHKENAKSIWLELQHLGGPGSPIKISKEDLQKVIAHFDHEGAKLDF